MFTSELNLQARRRRIAFLFLAPTLTTLLCVTVWPLVRTIWFSFTDTTTSHLYEGHWIGFDNYLSLRTLASGKVVWKGTLVDPAWWNAVWNTLYFTILSLCFETTFGLIIALTLNTHFRGRNLLRTAILIPWVIPSIVSAKMWGWMLNDQFGIINDFLLNVGLIREKIAWTANFDTAMISVLFVDIWKTTPFMTLLILSGLQMIPPDIYEAACLDGVHPVKVFFHITLPLIWPTLFVAIIFRVLDALRMFDLVYILTPGSSATKTMSAVSRENMIDFDQFAYGAAQSTLLFLFLIFFVSIALQISKTKLLEE
ncbi:MAG: trehalose/maltose transport system permease protein [Candidatus Tokpelaia sp. JSC161]|jgi:trehalose/maltose transport system permease protein|nr:MAG: trehalose/maltose transport system permease protein [Candidatus Tokpelaia sp. JSC161]